MKKLLLLIIILFSISHSFAQEEQLSEKEKARREKNIQAGNPFKRFGYTPKIATLSKGKYLEFHDLDSIVRIGSFTYNVKRKALIGYTKLDTVHPESTLRPEIISRWFSPDPLSDEFPSWSPYNFVYNNPVRFVDPDGRAPADWIKDRYGGYLWDDNAVSQATTRSGWDYVGKNLPSGVDRYNVLTEVNGGLYHKNTNNVFASAGNSINSFFGGDNDYFVNHKPYDPVGENNLREGINAGGTLVGGNLIFKGLGKVISPLLTNPASKQGMITVGRWMSKVEYKLMQSTGQMLEGAGGQTFVSVGGPEAFKSAVKGSVYAEFQVSKNSLLQGGKDLWFKALGPNSGKAMQGALQKQGGTLLPKIQNLSEILLIK